MSDLAYTIPKLPLPYDLETKHILKQVTKSHTALAELKGVCAIIPNENILIQTLVLQEARKSSEIENIVTTQDDLYASDVLQQDFKSPEAKEVHNYSHALLRGYETVKEHRLFLNKDIIQLYKDIEQVDTGFRSVSVYLKDNAGRTIYTPPEKKDDIIQYMDNLEKFMNDDSKSDLDDLIKMAIIHHQFESIHPFHDGNGRSGRIINVLYLVQKGLLDLPILYLSRYINSYKQEYYRLLQAVQENPDMWQEWILFMLQGVEKTARETISLVHEIRNAMQETKNTIRSGLPSHIYSQDLINALYLQPYTKIKYIATACNVSEQTASRYLEQLVDKNILSMYKYERENYYLNDTLIGILMGDL